MIRLIGLLIHCDDPVFHSERGCFHKRVEFGTCESSLRVYLLFNVCGDLQFGSIFQFKVAGKRKIGTSSGQSLNCSIAPPTPRGPPSLPINEDGDCKLKSILRWVSIVIWIFFFLYKPLFQLLPSPHKPASLNYENCWGEPGSNQRICLRKSLVGVGFLLQYRGAALLNSQQHLVNICRFMPLIQYKPITMLVLIWIFALDMFVALVLRSPYCI